MKKLTALVFPLFFSSSLVLAGVFSWPTNGADIVLDASYAPTEIDYIGLQNNYGSISFTADAPLYQINLRKGASLLLTGAGITDANVSHVPDTPSAITDKHMFTLQDSSYLTFRNTENAPAPILGSVRIINLGGEIGFYGNSSAGTANIFNQGVTAGGPATKIIFAGHSTAASSTLALFGSASSELIFTDNSHGGTAQISNEGLRSIVRFKGNTTTEALTLNLAGTGATVIFDGDNVAIGNASARTTINAGGGQDTIAYFGNATSGNINYNGNGVRSNATFSKYFKASGSNFTACASTTSSIVNILGSEINATKYEINVRGVNSRLTIKGGATFGGTGRFVLTSSGFMVLENTSIVGAQVILQGDSHAQQGIGRGSGANLNIGDKVDITIRTTSQMTGGNNILTINGTETYWRSSSAFTQSGAISTFNIGGSANVTMGVHTVSGEDAWLRIDGNADYKPTSIALSGINANLFLGGSANLSVSAANGINVTGNGGSVHITDNATLTASSTLRNVPGAGNTSTWLIDGNAQINGSAALNSLSQGNAIKIGGTATINGLTLNQSAASSNIIITDAPNLLTAGIKIDSGAGLILENTTVPVEIASFTQIKDSVVSFIGETAHFIYNGGTQANITLDDQTRSGASLTHNSTSTLTLNNINTLAGNLTALRGTITINHTEATEKATLNFTQTGTINFGTNAGMDIILGGIAGDGEFAAGTRNFEVGNNNRDSVFSGIVTGSGNITKIGDGTLSLAGSATFDNITVASGYLGLSVNSDTDYTTAIIGTLNLDTTDQLRVSIAPGLGLAEGTVLPGVLTILTELNIDGVSNIAGLDDLSVNTDGRATFTFNSSTVGIYDLVAGKPLAFGDAKFAATRNQRTVGSALDEIEAAGTNTALIDGFNTLTTARITEALNELSPAGLGAMADLAHRQAAADLRIITQRFDQYKNSPNAPLSGSRLTTGVSGANILVPDTETATIPWTAYFAIRHSQGDKDGRRDAPGYDHDSNGISVGLDQAFAKRRGLYGFQFAYENSEADLDYSRGKVELESFRLMTYLGWFDARGLWIQAHASFNMHDYETTRNLPTLGGRNTGSTDGIGFTGSLEIGKTYDFVKPRVRIHSGDGVQTVPAKTSAWSHAPYARLTYDTASIDSFAEYGALETDYEKQTPQNLASRLAWRLQWKSVTRKSTRLNANLDLGWEHEYMDARNDIEFRFAGTTSRRTVRGAKTARDSFVAGLNLAMLTARDLHFTLAYDLDLNADYTDHRLNIGFGRKF